MDHSAFMFERKGIISLAKGELDPEEFELELIDAGVEEIELEEDTFMITTPMEDFHNVQIRNFRKWDWSPKVLNCKEFQTTRWT